MGPAVRLGDPELASRWATGLAVIGDPRSECRVSWSLGTPCLLALRISCPGLRAVDPPPGGGSEVALVSRLGVYSLTARLASLV